MRRRFLKEQDGFTLPEMLVTMVIMLAVLSALYNIFDMSLKVFRFGNDKVEAVENARLGLEKMAREIRAAYPVNGRLSTGDNRYRFFDATSGTTNATGTSPPPRAWPTDTQITFGNELSPTDDSIRCPPSPATCEYITYKLRGRPPAAGGPLPLCANDTAPCTLRRVNAASSAGDGDPVVDFVRAGGLSLKYFKKDGTEISAASPGICPKPNLPNDPCTPQDIGRVEISLQVEKDGRRQDLKTVVDLRNPGRLND